MRHPARREQLAVEADVGAVGQLDVAVLARQDRVAADEDAAADSDAAIGVALRVEQAVVVDDDVAADVDLVRMAQHDVLAEHDVAPARAEQRRIQRLAEREARARPAAAWAIETTSSYLQQRAQPRPADDERRVLLSRLDVPGAKS